MRDPAASSTYIPNVQILRLLAAGMVLLGHIQHEIVDLQLGGADYRPFEPFQWGAGVDIFFIVSGFIMFYLCHDRFGRPGEAKKFLIRRIIRLVPTYWIFTALMLAAAFAFRSQLAHADVSLVHLLASLFFIPWPNENGEILPFLILGWTLNYEVLFYLAFAGALLLPKKIGLIALTAGFAAAAAAHHLIPSSLWMLKFWSNPIILEFLFGFPLAWAFLKGYRLSVVQAVGLGAAGVCLLAAFAGSGWQPLEARVVWGGLPALLICAAFALCRQSEPSSMIYKGFVLAGTASYSLYLSHPFTINALAIIFRKLGGQSAALFMITTFIGAIVASIAIYLLIEKPMISFLSQRARTGS